MEQDTFLDWLFPALYQSSRYCFPNVCSPNVLKTHITQTIVFRLIVSVLQTNGVFSRFLLLSSSFNSKLSVNPSWVKWCIFKTSQRSHSLGRAQEVNFFPSGAVRDKNPLWARAVIFLTSAHALPNVRNSLTSSNGCFQSHSFPDHVTKKQRALGTRMLKIQNGELINLRIAIFEILQRANLCACTVTSATSIFLFSHFYPSIKSFFLKKKNRKLAVKGRQHSVPKRLYN